MMIWGTKETQRSWTIGNLYSLGLLTPIPSAPGAADYDDVMIKVMMVMMMIELVVIHVLSSSRSHNILLFSLLLRETAVSLHAWTTVHSHTLKTPSQYQWANHQISTRFTCKGDTKKTRGSIFTTNLPGIL